MSESDIQAITVFGIFGCVAGPWFIFVGFLMRSFDFSFLFTDVWGEKAGLVIKTPAGIKKIAEDTPENKVKFSKILGNIFLTIGIAVLIISILALIIHPKIPLGLES